MTRWDGRLLSDIMADIRHIKLSCMQYLLFHQVISGWFLSILIGQSYTGSWLGKRSFKTLQSPIMEKTFFDALRKTGNYEPFSAGNLLKIPCPKWVSFLLIIFSVCTSLFPVCPGSIIDSSGGFDRSYNDRSYLGDLPLRACNEICDMLNQNVKWNRSRIELFPDWNTGFQIQVQ